MNWMFYKCSSLTSLDVSGFTTSGSTDMTAMFSGCSKIERLDLSGFESSGYNASWMFSEMKMLREVVFGDGFEVVIGGTLPTPDPAYIQGADGLWYNSAGAAFKAIDIPSWVADTYTAVPPATADPAATAGGEEKNV